MLLLVVGALVLVLLIGTALLITMSDETRRVAIDARVTEIDTMAENVTAHVLNLLRQDIWGTNDVLLDGNPSLNVWRPGEVLDEPFDGFSNFGIAPDGSEAPWIGDAWLASTVPYSDPTVQRLRWRRMSWAPLDERAALVAMGRAVGGVPRNPSVITDEWPIYLARDGEFSTFQKLFVDADGDGLRDAVRLRKQFPGALGERFDLGIRIIDHGSMLNVNTCFTRPAWAIQMQGKLDYTMPRGPLALPGRAVTELMLDPLLERREANTPEGIRRGAEALLLRADDVNPSTVLRRPDLYAAAFLRGRWLTDWPLSRYAPVEVEATLRHRNALLPFQASSNLGTKQLERDFRGTLLRTPVVLPGGGTWMTPYAQYDEKDPSDFPFWAAKLDPNSPFFNRRLLLTTTSKSQERILLPRSVITGAARLPVGMRLPIIVEDVANNLLTAFSNPGNPERVGRPVFHPQTGELIPPGNRFDLVDINAIPDFDGDDTIAENELAIYAGQLAGAMWLALEGDPAREGDEVDSFQGTSLDPTARKRVAWQFAANVIDYRDGDFEPYWIPDSMTGVGDVYGVEPQPFLTEVYAKVAADSNGNVNFDASAFAVELHNPFEGPLELDGLVIEFSVARAGRGELELSGVLRSGAYTVFNNDPQDDSIPGERDASLITFNPDTQRTFVELKRRMRQPGAARDIPLDRIGKQGQFGEVGTETSLQRSTSQWRWAVAVQVDNKPHTLERANAEAMALENPDDHASYVAPSPWVFRWVDTDGDGDADRPIGLSDPWAFDSVIQLANVFLVGPDPTRDPDDPRRTVPGFVAAAQSEFKIKLLDELPLAEQRVGLTAAGRLDFAHGDRVASSQPWSHRVLEYFAVHTAATDAVDLDGDGRIQAGEWIDNDGDGIANELTESYDVYRSSAGRLNINTAPELALRAVQYFYSSPRRGRIDFAQAIANQVPAELAQAIEAYREGRPVIQREQVVLDAYHRSMIPFSSTADLARLAPELAEAAALRGASLSTNYRMDYLALDNRDLANPPELDSLDGDGVLDDFRERDAILARVVNLLTTRSDVYTVYFVLVDNRGTPNDPDDDIYTRRVQLTVDRTNCYRNPDVLPEIIARDDISYYDVKR